jgi:prohibitin 2
MKALIAGGVALVLLVVLASSVWPFASVPAGHRGLVVLFGNPQAKVLEPGLNVVNPMAHVVLLSTQTQKTEIKGEAASHDLQAVHTTIVANYHLNTDRVAELYSRIGMDYENKVLVGPGQDSFKAATSHYTADQMITKREDVRQEILASMRAKVQSLSDNTVVVDDLFITNFDFAPTFNHAIEAKQEAEQLALKAQRDLERIKIEAAQKVATAEAEAAALRAQKDQITPELIQLRQTQNQLAAIGKWDGKLPVSMIPGAALPFVNVGVAR